MSNDENAGLERLLREASEHIANDRPNEARALYCQVLAQRPDDPFVLHVFGLLEAQAGDTLRGMELVERAIAVKPDFAQAYKSMGDLYADQPLPGKAADYYQRALTIDPELAEARERLADMARLMGQAAAVITSPPELALWTPVRLNLNDPEPSVDWCDMTGERFTDPFFKETVDRLTKGEAGRSIVRTPLEALIELDGTPSLDPCGLVFHMGRCGSTLLARLLGLIPGVVAVREPPPINSLLEVNPARIDESTRVRILRALVRAFGRVRFGDERHLIVKLSSWNIRMASLFRLAFPEIPMVWLQRRPIEVLASMIEAPPGWLSLRNNPAAAAQLFGVDPSAVTRTDGFGFAGLLLASMLDAAAGTDACVVDYSELPDAAADLVAPYLGLNVTAADRAAMGEQARFNAKSAVPQTYVGDSERIQAVPERAIAVTQSLLDARYTALDKRRMAQHRIRS